MNKVKKDKVEYLTPKQARFIRAIKDGKGKEVSAIIAGYSPKTASSQATQLLKKTKITKALDRAGLSDKAISEGIKTNIEAGMGVKATADTSLKGLALASKLKGHGQPQQPTSLSQTNVYIEEMKNMNDKELNAKLDTLTEEVQELKPTPQGKV